MSRLNTALARFNAALEQAESGLASLSNGHAERNGEIARLHQERDRLLARVAALEEEASSLAGVTQTVEARLDGAIAEIRTALSRSP
jgi:hypothetical protein